MEANKKDEIKVPRVLTPVSKSADKPAKAKFVVKTEFRDINDFSKVHHAGKDVSYMGKDRLEHLVNTGVVEKK